jgi:hypothetical protein
VFAPQPEQMQARPQVVLASATAVRPKVSFATVYRASATGAPLMIEPAVAQQPAAFAPDASDLLGPLIVQSGGLSSYASSDEPSAAQHAADALAEPNALQAALNRAVGRKAVELGVTRPPETIAGTHAPSPVIQLGSFGDPANAKKLAANFTRFGQVETVAQAQNGRELTLVRVTVDPAVPQSAVIAAAQQAGLNGAFVLNQ